MALLDNLNVFGSVGFDPSNILESVGILSAYCDNETGKSDQQIRALDERAKLSPRESLSAAAKNAEKDVSNAIGSLSPINASKLFDDTIATKVQHATNKLVDKTVARAKEEVSNVEKQIEKALDLDFDIIETVNDAWDVAQNSLALVLTTNGRELFILSMRDIAKRIISRIEAREESIQQIIDYSNLLYNELRFIVNGSDQAGLYLQRLQQVLASLIIEERNLRSVRNTLARRNLFNKFNYEQITNNLDALISQMRPPGNNVDGGFFQDLFDEVLPSPIKKDGKAASFASSLDELLNFEEEEKRFQTLLSIHLTIEKLGRACLDFSLRTTEINSLISAYISGQSEFEGLQDPTRFSSAIVNHMDGSLDDLSELILDMDDELNDDPLAGARKPFQKSRISLLGPEWAIRLTGVVAHMKTLPSTTAGAVSEQLEIAQLFLDSVAALENIDTLSGGIATMSVEDSKEQPAELTEECIKISGTAFRAISSFEISPETEQRFFFIRDRAILSQRLSQQIIDILTPFATAESTVLNTANRLASKGKDLLRSLGFDKAADQIDLGQFDKTLREGAQAASYIGSAVIAVNSLIEGVEACPATDERDVQALEEVRDELRGEELRKELNARRVARSSRRARQRQIEVRKQEVQDKCEKVNSTAFKCVEKTDQPRSVTAKLRDVTGGIIDIG